MVALLDPTPGVGEEPEPTDFLVAFFVASISAASRVADSLAAFAAESSITTRASTSSVAFFTIVTSVVIFFAVTSLVTTASIAFLATVAAAASAASLTNVEDSLPPDPSCFITADATTFGLGCDAVAG
jgi:hypothetical protein